MKRKQRLAVRKSLTARISSAFLFLALLTVATVGSVSFVRAREALKQAAFERLNLAASLKQQEIDRWFEERERDFLMLIRSPDTQANLEVLLNADPNAPAYQAAYAKLIDYFNSVAVLKPSFNQLSLLNRSNQIVLSTDQSHLGKHVITTNLTYFEGIEPGETFSPIFYRSPTTGNPAITFAAPIRNGAGQRQGVILADLDLEQIAAIVNTRSGLGATGETYLVGALVNRTTFMFGKPPNLRLLPPQIRSQGIDRAMQGVSGAGLYPNYENVPIIGIYRWLNNQNMALLAEMSQEEAFGPARQLAITIILVGLISTGGLFIGVNWLARQLKRSQKQLEAYSHQLEKKAQEAEAANRAKSDFLANMSHELRTPLNAILGFAQLLEHDAKIGPTQLKQLNIISRSGAHLLNLINDVLSMAKIEAGRTTLAESSFDLYHLLGSLEDMLRVKAEAKGLALEVTRSPNLPQYIKTDEHKLRQVLINLLGNAIKFTETGRVTLQVQEAIASPSADLRSLDFEIVDTGPGISPAELDHLFDPFFQAAKPQKAQQGTGLGLTISQEFVNLMGGEIAVRRTSEQGSTFGFQIWVKLADPVEAQPQTLERRITHLAPGQPKCRILVVEDSWDNRCLLVQLLTAVGFDVQEAENGQAAVEHWLSWKPHLIWMDLRMPVMDGDAAIRQIRKLEAEQNRTAPPTKIIVLTASVFEEERVAILSSGCDDFVRKPFQQQTIFEKMAEHLGVVYQYEEPLVIVAPRIPSSESPNSPELNVMPQEWIAKLQQAAIEVDADLVLQLVEEIPPEHDSLIKQLKDLIRHFCFDEIIDLTQKSLSGSAL